MFAKLWKSAVFTLLAYLMQATVALHISIWDVSPNIALAMAAIVTVALGRKYTFLMTLAVGYLLEVMLPVLDFLSLILYPVCGMLGALAFSDKSERRLEEERSTGTRKKLLDPHLRTPLCAMLSVAVFEGIHVMYIYLNGIVIDSGHITRALICIGYSSVIAAVLQFPARLWFGTYRLKKAR